MLTSSVAKLYIMWHCSSHTLKPFVLQALGCSGSLLREIVQHWSQEGSELGCIFFRPRVLFRHYIAETPRSQVMDVFQLSFSVEKVPGEPAFQGNLLWDGSKQLNDMGKVVFIASVLPPGT